jgi:16S rRNA (guanine527-N7)-methyltransferase
LVDVGTGAGLPGLILKIVEPTIELTLLESISKKCNFLEAACTKLGFDHARVICDRAENYANGPDRESYDVVVARAVAPLPVLLELSLPLLRLNGYLVPQKGKKATEETVQARAAADVLGGKIVDVKKIKSTGMNTERVLVLVEKVAPTPAGYPRRAGIPAKRPLGGRRRAKA